MAFFTHKFFDLQKINHMLTAILIVLSIVCLIMFTFFDFDSWSDILGGLSQPITIFFLGLFFLSVLPRNMHDATLCCLLLGMNGYLLFWCYVLLVVLHAGGLPPWKIGIGPWV